jgi:transposase
VETACIARAGFPKGNLYISMRDELGTLFAASDFTALYPKRGQPAFAPWRLALITVMQFLENLSDRQTAEAVRSRIDWKYVLSLELTDSGFDYSVLRGFRQRLITSGRQSLIFDRLIELLRDKKLLKERGTQRTDSTHVLASIRVMNRLEVITETMRAALNQLAILAPAWLKSVASPEWQIRYCSRAEQSRFPTGEKARADYGKKVGRDGSHLLKLIETEQPQLAQLEIIETLRKVWAIHYSRYEDGELCWRTDSQLPKGAVIIESPYDTEARHSKKRGLNWTG